MEPVFYEQNHNLPLSIIETVSGKKEYQVNCKKIKDGFYIINQECFLVNNRWYRVSSGLIEFDHETKKWEMKGEKKLIHGIIEVKDKLPVYGYFTANPYNNCNFCDEKGNVGIAINSEMLLESGCFEDFSTGMWYSKMHSSFQVPRNVIDRTTKGYSIEDNEKEYIEKKKLFEDYKVPASKNLTTYAHMLGGTTFGLEIEASHGNLPDHLQNRLGIVICRDGSLKDEGGMPGPEFVTIPMSGVRGLQAIKEMAPEITKRTKLNLNCSLHIHFGTLPTSRDYLVTLYRLCYKIQNEMFTMFPYYKANPDGIKNKNYNQKLKSLAIETIPENTGKEEYRDIIDSSYKRLFSWLAEGYTPDKKRNRKNKVHPKNAKWERNSRYYWVNFMNVIFSERNTIEFRLHTPTTNSQKMTNWLFICNAILKYAMANMRKILTSDDEITLSEIMSYYSTFGKNGQFLAEYLNAYIEERKEKFRNDYIKGDAISTWDFEDDHNYKFIYNNIHEF